MPPLGPLPNNNIAIPPESIASSITLNNAAICPSCGGFNRPIK